jgi:DNA-binding transcriptional ArsR family regulator
MEIDRARAEEWAPWFQALGDPTRILILHLLATEQRALSVGEIVEQRDVGQSTISHHMAKHAECGFVFVDRVGTTSRWEVNQRCLDCFPTAAQIVFDRVPDRFTRALESR